MTERERNEGYEKKRMQENGSEKRKTDKQREKKKDR
jgi:hypothetical protein